jgi:hypothetical protein
LKEACSSISVRPCSCRGGVCFRCGFWRPALGGRPCGLWRGERCPHGPRRSAARASARGTRRCGLPVAARRANAFAQPVRVPKSGRNLRTRKSILGQSRPSLAPLDRRAVCLYRACCSRPMPLPRGVLSPSNNGRRQSQAAGGFFIARRSPNTFAGAAAVEASLSPSKSRHAPGMPGFVANRRRQISRSDSSALAAETCSTSSQLPMRARDSAHLAHADCWDQALGFRCGRPQDSSGAQQFPNGNSA